MSAGRFSPDPSRECKQHVLDDGVSALTMLDHLFEVGLQHLRQFADVTAHLLIERRWSQGIVQFVDQFG